MKTGWEEHAEKRHRLAKIGSGKQTRVVLPRRQEFQEVMSKRNHRTLESESTGFSPNPVSHQLHNPSECRRMKKIMSSGSTEEDSEFIYMRVVPIHSKIDVTDTTDDFCHAEEVRSVPGCLPEANATHTNLPSSQHLLTCVSAELVIQASSSQSTYLTSSTWSDVSHCVMGVFFNQYSENVVHSNTCSS